MALVGLRVYNAAKAGVDAGRLCDLPDCGVLATNDPATLHEVAADCVVFMGQDSLISDPRVAGSQAHGLVGEICGLLESGRNVVSTSVVGLSHPPYFGAAVTKRIADACRRGGTSFHCAGLDPGFIGDVLLTSITSLSQEICSVRYYELLTAKEYNDPNFVFGIGFGKPIEAFRKHGMVFSLGNCWGPTLAGIADALGVVVDEQVERVEVAPTERDTAIAAGVIPAGTVGAIHFELAAMSGGREVITVEHVSRVDESVAPQWSRFDGTGGYRVVIEGTPSMQVDLTFGHQSGKDPTYEACIATAARAVNSIPNVCAAAPGILTYRDLLPVAGKGLVRP